MKLLLDTHIWLWNFGEPARLGPKLRAALRSGEHVLWISAVSLWETIILLQKGRVVLPQSLDYLVSEWVQAGSLQVAPVTAAVALEVARIRLPHRDPADRLLAATARVFDMTLVTADQQLLEMKDIAVMGNR